jgi:hypothetical protein
MSEEKKPSVELVIAEIYVKWNNTLQRDLHNRMVYVLSKTQNLTDDEIKEKINEWLKPDGSSDAAYSEANIATFERAHSDNEDDNIMLSPKLAAGFVHVDMETMQVHYYAAEPVDDEPPPGDIIDVSKN